MKISLEDIEGFQWDKGNIEKNWLKHKVLNSECEQVFFNEPLIVADDVKHTQKEKRWFVLGRTELDRKLFIVFTVRKNLIRVISARDMTKKERKGKYIMKKLKNIPKFESEEEERDFWSKNDSSEFINWNKSKFTSFPNLKPSTKTISLRLPEFLLNDIKIIAHKRDVPYQSLIKIILKERIDNELRN